MQRLGRIAATLSGLVVALAVFAPRAIAARPTLISVDPPSGVPGQTVTVRGSGFCGTAGCSRVRIEVYGVTVAQNVRVSPAGRFSRRLRVPGGATGEVGFIAAQTLANGAEVEALANFEYLVRGVPPTKAKSQTTQPKPKRTSGGGTNGPNRTGPSGTPRPAPTTPTAEITPTPVRHVPPPVATAPTETVQTTTNGNDHRRAAPPVSVDDDGASPVAWGALAAACIACAAVAFFAVRTRRRQRASAR